MNDKLGLAEREKYWNERDTEEKLDALRDQVLQLTYKLGQVSGVVESLLHHAHADGKIFTTIDRRERSEVYTPHTLRFGWDKQRGDE